MVRHILNHNLVVIVQQAATLLQISCRKYIANLFTQVLTGRQILGLLVKVHFHLIGVVF